MKKNILITFTLIALMLSSCHTPNVAYFSDLKDGQTEAILQKLEIRIRPEDKLSIVIKSKDPMLADLFNLPVIAHRVGYSQTSLTNTSQQLSVYTVDSQGCIDFPVLGTIQVAGLKREEVAAKIKSELINSNQIKDPVVTVEYANNAFDVLGEVTRPGRYVFDRDRLTLLDAISMAGDLTIYGQRENVLVMRENGEQRTTYRVNLLSGKELYESPVFYLQQNDVIVVEPNEYRARQATVNGNNVRSTSFWISIASLLTSICVLVFK